VVALAGDDLLRFAHHPGDELRRVGRGVVDPGAGLDELLPDHDAQLVAAVVERLRLDQPAAPYPQQIDVGLAGQPQQMLQLLRARHAVEYIQRYPVPALGVNPAAVDLQRVRARVRLRAVVGEQRHVADAKASRAGVGEQATFRIGDAHPGFVEGLLAMPVGPPQARLRGRQIDAEAGLAGGQGVAHPLPGDGGSVQAQHRLNLDGLSLRNVQRDRDRYVGVIQIGRKLRADEHVRDARRAADLQGDVIPDAEVDHARAEVPPVSHAALVGAHPARPPDLRLLRRGRRDDHRQRILRAVAQPVADLEGGGGEHAGVCPQRLAVEEELRLVVHASEDQPDARPPEGRIDGERPAVEPGAGRDPFQQQAVALEVRVGDFARPPQVVVDAAGHAGRPPVAGVAGGGQVRAAPAPVLPVVVLELPVSAVEADATGRHHSSKSVSTTGRAGSRGTRKVLISPGAKCASMVRPQCGRWMVAPAAIFAVS